ncbi:flagellar hook-basal body complex protein [Bradyrhizobium sp.]|jgi:flagellar hook protein FlgE|uniref:flagellar hook-basal body complex protein n=1 Tax=Bradyrhizobium sp. TaxID=376 RepID=UPI003C152147
MGIFDALNTAVGGLQSQSFALQNISGNIANASTTGYKGIDTTFEDLIPDATSPSRQVAGGVTAFAQQTITTQGTVSTTTVATNMAINGDGFFSVQQSTGETDNIPIFSGTTDYTRRGDFQVNANGNLVNGAGYYLMGETVDPKTGNVTGSVPQVLQFQNNFIPSQTTTSINYAANLPSTPTTISSPTATAGTITALGGLNPLDFSQNPTLTAATGYTDATTTGTAVSNGLGATITTSTKLSGGAGDNLNPGFAAGNTIDIDGTTYTFVNTGSTAGTTGTNIDISDTVGTLLNTIGAVTGVQPVLTPGATTGTITLHTGTAANLAITVTPSPGVGATAFAALGFAGGVVNLARTAVPSPPTGVVVANDEQTFLNESISGGAITAYDATGTAVNLQLRWAKVDSAGLGGTHANTWNLFYQSAPSATGTNAEWTNVGTPFTFSSSGTLTSPATPAVTIPNVKVGTQTLGTISFNVAAGSLTQYASTSGTATINAVTQNGYAAGQLQSVAINNNGIVVGAFSNGQNLDLASVTLSHFNGTNYLQALDGGAYAATSESGAAIQGASGTISGSSLEGSNTDIASEFTKLIVTQQAYSANTKIITTANTMIQDLLNVLR